MPGERTREIANCQENVSECKAPMGMQGNDRGIHGSGCKVLGKFR